MISLYLLFSINGIQMNSKKINSQILNCFKRSYLMKEDFIWKFLISVCFDHIKIEKCFYFFKFIFGKL